MIKRWLIAPKDDKASADIADSTGLPLFVTEIMTARGIKTPQQAKRFLSGEIDFQSPESLAGMPEAVERVSRAINEGERICVYGDYDCDGITATALLTTYLQSVGADVFYYIPSRETEGYGMNKSAMDTLLSMETNLIITVDNGISAHAEIAYAKALGIDVVVTDHHTPRPTLPDAPVVNPHRHDCESTYKELAGVGVAFTLICALEGADADEILEHYSDLVAIGTIADVVPLTGENRAIVRHGLAQLPESPRPGIHALMEIAGISGEIGARSVAFGIAPRINAAGRLGEVDEAVELLMTEDAAYAPELAAKLNELNIYRRQIEDRILGEITAKINRSPQLLNRRMLLISGRGWHHGVVGIVASRLVERYGKPCILFAVDGDEARGSGRAIEGFSLIEAITACEERLTRFGGHKLAAGLTLPVGELAWFGETIEAFCAEKYPVMPIQSIPVDCVLEPQALTAESIKALSLLEPFGAENPQPQLALPGMTLGAILPTSDGKHLRLRVSKGMNELLVIMFRMEEERFPYRVGDELDLVVSAELGEFRGAEQLSVIVQELRPAGFDADEVLPAHERYQRHCRGEYSESCRREDILPDRDLLASVYRFIKQRGKSPTTPELIFAAEKLPFDKLCVALDVLTELELAERIGEGIRLISPLKRVDLAQSKILAALSGE